MIELLFSVLSCFKKDKCTQNVINTTLQRVQHYHKSSCRFPAVFQISWEGGIFTNVYKLRSLINAAGYTPAGFGAALTTAVTSAIFSITQGSSPDLETAHSRCISTETFLCPTSDQLIFISAGINVNNSGLMRICGSGLSTQRHKRRDSGPKQLTPLPSI